MSERDLAGEDGVPTANKSRRGAGVMGSSKGGCLKQTHPLAEQPGRTPDSGDHQRVLGVELREQSWETSSEHALSAPGRSFEE